MNEVEKGLLFDRWTVTDGSNVTLESPIVAIGSGHLDVYLEDPENAFDGLGISIKKALPDAVVQAFEKCETQGVKLHVQVKVRGAQHDFILIHRPDADRYPWRLVKD